MDASEGPVFQLYVLAPPLAVKVLDPPLHTSVCREATLTVGVGLTRTICVIGEVQPNELLPTTEKRVGARGLDVRLDPVEPPGDQV